MASDNYTMNYMMQRARSIINSSKTTNNIDANSVESDDIIICNKIDCNSIKANTIIVYGNVDCNNINAENVLVLNGENDYASLDKKYFDIDDNSKVKVGDGVHKYSELPSLKLHPPREVCE